MSTHTIWRRNAFLSLIACIAFDARSTPAAPTQPHVFTAEVAVGPQYDSTHVYVSPDDLEAFVASFIATFGGRASKPIVATVTPSPSSTQFQYVMSPVGTLSVFAYSSPIPFPFGLERTGYLVTDMDQALNAARSAGASIIVSPFKDAIGIDAIIAWPGASRCNCTGISSRPRTMRWRPFPRIASMSRLIALTTSSTPSRIFPVAG